MDAKNFNEAEVGMKHRALSEFCDLNMGQSPDSSTYNNQGEGLPFYQGNADFGIIHPTARVWCSSPVKRAHAEDILISVRAPIGAMNIAAEECCIGRGLAALTPKQDVCSQKYLYYALESRVDLLVSKGTGSTFKAISKKILEETELPAYPMQKQKEIVHVLETVDSLIGQRHTEAEYLDQLVKSRFVELFGDPVSNSRGLPEKTLSEMGEFGRGVSKHRPRNDPKLLGGKHPLIQTGDVAAADLYITEYNSTYSDLGLEQSKMWRRGTLCITIAANIAKTAILDFDACFPDSVVGFIANEKTNNVYIHYWFSFFRKW